MIWNRVGIKCSSLTMSVRAFALVPAGLTKTSQGHPKGDNIWSSSILMSRSTITNDIVQVLFFAVKKDKQAH